MRAILTLGRSLLLPLMGALMAVPVATQAQTLTQALAQAYLYSPTLLSAQAQAIQAVETYNQTVAQSKLSIGATFSANSTNGNQFGNSTFTTTESGQTQITFSQPLYQGSPGGIPAGIRQAFGGIVAAQSTYEGQEMQVLFNAVSAYMNVLAEEGSLGVAISDVARREQELEAAQARLDAGEGTRTEIALAEAGLAQAQSARTLTAASLASARATYQQLMGAAPTSLRDPGFPTLPVSQAVAIDLALARHPGVLGARANVAVAQDGLITTRDQYGLAIAANGSLTRNWQDTGSYVDQDAYSIGISASIPLMDSGVRNAAIRSAEQNLRAAEAALQGQEDAVRAQVVAAWGNARAQFDNLNSLILVAQAQEIVLAATEAEFDAGTATFLQVQNARQDFVAAQNQYVRGKSTSVIAAYNLIMATGGLTSEVQGLEVPHFDLMAALDENRNLTYVEMLFGVRD